MISLRIQIVIFCTGGQIVKVLEYCIRDLDKIFLRNTFQQAVMAPFCG